MENLDHKTVWLGFVNAKPQYLIAILVAVCANIVISILYHHKQTTGLTIHFKEFFFFFFLKL